MKKQWIRIISFIMMICMISMVSIGCGRSNQDSGKKVTINILNYKRETVDILQKMIDKFEKENPNIHIQMDSPSDAMTILKTRLVKENPPDIAILGGERSYADFVDADTIVDISDYKGLDKVKDVYKDMAKQLELSKKKGTYHMQQMPLAFFIIEICLKNMDGRFLKHGMNLSPFVNRLNQMERHLFILC